MDNGVARNRGLQPTVPLVLGAIRSSTQTPCYIEVLRIELTHSFGYEIGMEELSPLLQQLLQADAIRLAADRRSVELAEARPGSARD